MFLQVAAGTVCGLVATDTAKEAET